MQLNLNGFMRSRAIVEPQRKLSAQELKTRICDYFGCSLLDSLAKNVS
jgi:hypothetical protein